MTCSKCVHFVNENPQDTWCANEGNMTIASSTCEDFKPDSSFLLKILQATSFDNCEEIWWRTDGEFSPFTIFAGCSDQFFWACSDSETVTPENVDTFAKSYEDLKAIDNYFGSWGSVLFAARVRGMRPHGWAYPFAMDFAKIPGFTLPDWITKEKLDKVWDLFDAAGPPRKSCTDHPRGENGQEEKP